MILRQLKLITTAREFISLLLVEYDGPFSESRSRERYRRIFLTGLTAVAARGVGIITALVSVPLTLHYLGVERYGLWMTISTTIAMLGFADLGMGNGLINAISEADGKEDKDSARIYVSSAFFMLLALAVLNLLVFAAIYPFVSWPDLFNIKSELASREVGFATIALIVCFTLSLPLGVAQRAQMGFQEGARANIWTAAGSIFGLIGVLLAIYYKAGLPWLALVMSGGPVLGLLINWYDLYRSRGWLLPAWKYFDWNASRRIAGTGVLFLILQIFTLLGNATDNLVISHIFGTSAVAGYAVTQKLFSVTQIAQYFITPLWPAFGEAMARNDIAWARRTLNRALVLSILSSILISLPLVFAGKRIINMWVGPDLVPSSVLLIGFGFWTLLAAYGGSMSMFLNSGALLGKQTWFYGIASIGALALKIVLAKNWQIAGVIWATVIGYGSFYVVPAAWLAYGSLRIETVASIYERKEMKCQSQKNS